MLRLFSVSKRVKVSFSFYKMYVFLSTSEVANAILRHESCLLAQVPFSKKKNKTCLTEPDYEDAGSKYCATDQTEERHLTRIRDFETPLVTQAVDLVSCRVREQLANSSANGFSSSSLSFAYFVCRHPCSSRNSPQGGCLLRKTDPGGDSAKQFRKPGAMLCLFQAPYLCKEKSQIQK
jgi:hypothetical protein